MCSAVTKILEGTNYKVESYAGTNLFNGIIEPAEPLNRSKFPPVQNSNELVAEKIRFLRHSQLE